MAGEDIHILGMVSQGAERFSPSVSLIHCFVLIYQIQVVFQAIMKIKVVIIISVQVALSQNNLNRLICLLTCSQPAPSSVAPAAILSGTTLAPTHFPAAWEKGLVLRLKETAHVPATYKRRSGWIPFPLRAK
jgi:hypothetical protein